MITNIKNQIELVWDEVMKMFAITTNNHHVWDAYVKVWSQMTFSFYCTVMGFTLGIAISGIEFFFSFFYILLLISMNLRFICFVCWIA